MKGSQQCCAWRTGGWYPAVCPVAVVRGVDLLLHFSCVSDLASLGTPCTTGWNHASAPRAHLYTNNYPLYQRNTLSSSHSTSLDHRLHPSIPSTYTHTHARQITVEAGARVRYVYCLPFNPYTPPPHHDGLSNTIAKESCLEHIRPVIRLPGCFQKHLLTRFVRSVLRSPFHSLLLPALARSCPLLPAHPTHVHFCLAPLVAL